MLSPTTSYVKQKVFEACFSLVGDHDRLTFAALPLIVLGDPGDAVPDDARTNLLAIKELLTKEPLSNAVGYQPRAYLSEEEARAAANRLFETFVSLLGGL